jgi:hypothetical protein
MPEIVKIWEVVACREPSPSIAHASAEEPRRGPSNDAHQQLNFMSMPSPVSDRRQVIPNISTPFVYFIV